MAKKIKAELKFNGTQTGIMSMKPYRDDMQSDIVSELIGRAVWDCIQQNRAQGHDFQRRGFEVTVTIGAWNE